MCTQQAKGIELRSSGGNEVRVKSSNYALGPTEGDSGNLIGHFFLVLVFVYSKGAVI